MSLPPALASRGHPRSGGSVASCRPWCGRWAGGPRLIIPIDLWKGLDDHQRATLIIHELAHLRRGDHHLRFFELIVTALYWWHPVLWWARHSLRDVEEQCCDAWVVWAYPEAAKAYAETLLETLDFLNYSEPTEPLLASGFGKVHHLRKRLTMIMNGTTPRLLGIWGTLGSLGLAAVLLPVNATWAQKPEQKKEVTIIVKTDDESAEPTEAVATIDGGEFTVNHPHRRDGRGGWQADRSACRGQDRRLNRQGRR